RGPARARSRPGLHAAATCGRLPDRAPGRHLGHPRPTYPTTTRRPTRRQQPRTRRHNPEPNRRDRPTRHRPDRLHLAATRDDPTRSPPPTPPPARRQRQRRALEVRGRPTATIPLVVAALVG